MGVLLLLMAIGGGLAADQIRIVVMSHSRDLKSCYDSELAHDLGLKGTVTIAWKITPAGTVQSASVKQSTMGNARVEQCVVGVISSLRFPTADAPTNVAGFPFRFGS